MSRDDLFHGHIGGLDTLAQGLLGAAALIERGDLAAFVESRYAGWRDALGQRILGNASLADLSDHVIAHRVEPTPVSGRQELLETVVNRTLRR